MIVKQNGRRNYLVSYLYAKTFLISVDILFYLILSCIILYLNFYYILSHALKNTANQRPGLPLHILRYATGNMQRVVFHSTFPSLLARNSLLGSSKSAPRLFNSCEPLRTFPITSGNFPKISKHFRRFPKISEDFPKILKNHKAPGNTIELFPKFSKSFTNRLSLSKTG